MQLPIDERLKLALQEHAAGRAAEAESLCRSILAESARHADALHLLGVMVHEAGQYEKAIDFLERSLAASGADAVCHNNLAAANAAVGRWSEAETHSLAALRLQPNYADAHGNLGTALLARGQVGEGERALRTALQLAPGNVHALCLLAALLRRRGATPEAIALFTEAVRLAPDNPRARNGLGAALIEAEQPAAAETHLREAVRLAPEIAEAHNNLGLALRDQNRVAEAFPCFQEALRLKPDYRKARTQLGFLHSFEGRFDEARTEFQRVLQSDPDNVWALEGLSRLAAAGHHTFTPADIERIERIAAGPEVSIDDRIHLHFALSRVCEKAEDHDRAFEHCRSANDLLQSRLRERGVVYDPAELSREVDRLIAYFTPAFFERVRSFGSNSEVPIFVVGLPRSGTTLVEQIIASHPRAHGAGELSYIGAVTNALPRRLGTNEPYPACLDRLDASTARILANEYLSVLRQRGGMAERVIDKAPFNFKHLGLIAALFPHGKIVHCRRDAIDTCVSCYFQEFTHPLPFTLDLAHLGHHYRQYERLMAHYKRVLPVPIFALRYEDLIADQQSVSRALIDYCGLEWNDRCLSFHTTKRTVLTSSALQVRQPLYRSAVGRWKRYESHLGPLLEALGTGK